MEPRFPMPDPADTPTPTPGVPDEPKPDHLAEATALRMKAGVNWQVVTDHFVWAAKREINTYAAEVAHLRAALGNAEHAARTNLTRLCLVTEALRKLYDTIAPFFSGTDLGPEMVRLLEPMREARELLEAVAPYLK